MTKTDKTALNKQRSDPETAARTAAHVCSQDEQASDRVGGSLPYQYVPHHTPFRDLVPLRLRHGPPLCGVPHLELHRPDFRQLFHHGRHERITLVHQTVRETDEVAGVLRNAPEGRPVERAVSRRSRQSALSAPFNKTI